MIELLRKPISDPAVQRYFGNSLIQVERDEYYGSIEFIGDGVDVVFVEAPWAVSPEMINDPKLLYVSAFHLHRESHQGFTAFAGELPFGVKFGDQEPQVMNRIRSPMQTGGGGKSLALGVVPRWIKGTVDGVEFHFQFGEDKGLELVTLSAPDIRT